MLSNMLWLKIGIALTVFPFYLMFLISMFKSLYGESINEFLVTTIRQAIGEFYTWEGGKVSEAMMNGITWAYKANKKG